MLALPLAPESDGGMLNERVGVPVFFCNSTYIKCWSIVTGHDMKLHPNHIIWQLPDCQSSRHSMMALAIVCPVPAGSFVVPLCCTVLRGSVTMTGRWSTSCSPSSGNWLFAIPVNYQACVAFVRTSDLVCNCLPFGLHGSPDCRPIDGQIRNRNSKISNENTKMI